MGHQPSHVWRGIFVGLSLLKKGLVWRLGTGTEINIWNDLWLSGSSLGHPKYRFPGSDHYQYVSELWCRDNLSWNDDLLRSLFGDDDIIHIKATRLSPRYPADTIRWKFTDDGLYSVKSGYRCDFTDWWISAVQSTSQSVTPKTWNSVWSLNGPPRLLNFLWRLMDNNLPVRENLRRRGIIDGSNCPLCNACPESIVHLFMECPITKRLLLLLNITLVNQVCPSFDIAWEVFTQQKSLVECGKILAALWGIWKVRNLHVFDNPNPAEFHRILSWAVSYYEDYIAAQNSARRLITQCNTRWTPPPDGFIKVNTDAGVVSNLGGQVSAIARDEHGNFIRAAVKIIPAVQHPTLLEAYGILLAFDLLRELSCLQAIIENDCQPLVLALQSSRNCKSDLNLLVEDCRKASQAFEMIRFNFVRRSANTPAHILAKTMGPFSESVFLFAFPPSYINEALLQDVITVA